MCEAEVLDYYRENVYRCNQGDADHPPVQGDEKALIWCIKCRKGKPCKHLVSPKKIPKNPKMINPAKIRNHQKIFGPYPR
jgi:hypothetical protein